MFQSRALTRRRLARALLLGVGALALGPLRAEAGTGGSGETGDRILVLKARRRLILLRGGEPLAIFPIALGPHPIGPKYRAGDGRTPEGFYRVDGINPHSRYYRALRLSYPNPEDMQRAREAGVSPGGNIEIHGMPDNYGHFDPIAFYRDWTDGCIAVGNRAIDRICARVAIGTPVEIRA